MIRKDIPYQLLLPFEKVKYLIGEDGNIAFEHGYKHPEIVYKGERHCVTMIDYNKVHCYLKKSKGTLKVPYMIDLVRLSSPTLLKLENEIQKYIRFIKETVY